MILNEMFVLHDISFVLAVQQEQWNISLILDKSQVKIKDSA